MIDWSSEQTTREWRLPPLPPRFLLRRPRPLKGKATPHNKKRNISLRLSKSCKGADYLTIYSDDACVPTHWPLSLPYITYQGLSVATASEQPDGKSSTVIDLVKKWKDKSKAVAITTAVFLITLIRIQHVKKKEQQVTRWDVVDGKSLGAYRSKAASTTNGQCGGGSSDQRRGGYKCYCEGEYWPTKKQYCLHFIILVGDHQSPKGRASFPSSCGI